MDKTEEQVQAEAIQKFRSDMAVRHWLQVTAARVAELRMIGMGDAAQRIEEKVLVPFLPKDT